MCKGFQIEVVFSCDRSTYENKENSLGFFVLASNDMEEKFSPAQKLMAYKDQNKVEKGFRFLKDSAFLVCNLFVKKPERVEATLMIMSLCLLVYAALEKELRKALVEQEETLPNQSKKEVKNPTMKWIFILFRGIHVLYVEEKTLILNFNEIQQKVTSLFTHKIAKYYKLE